jgi:cell wall-associated NlpC family hydrolase
VAYYVRVAVPVADLRKRPIEARPFNIHDEMQESQVLFHEVLLVKEERAGWLQVDALEQQKSAPRGWQGYPGWIRKKDVTETEGPGKYDGVVKRPFTMVRAIPSAAGQPVFPLSLGTRLSLAGEAKGFIEVLMDGRQVGWVPKRDISGTVGTLPVRERAAEVVRTARLFLGAAYLWGGRSMPMPWSRGPVMGVDCSGLVNLVFRALHLELPRDAHDQWMTATAITAQALSPGDLIFLSRPGEVGSVNHVMLSLGGEQFIEAAETGDIVRIRTFSQMVGLGLRALEEKAFTLHDRRFYFGRIAY